MWLVLGCSLAGFGVWFTIEVYLTQGLTLLTLGYVVLTAFGLGTAIVGSRSSWVRVDDQTVSYKPAVGRPRVAPRSSIGSILPKGGGRGGPTFAFLDQAGKTLIRTGIGFDSKDVARVADYLGVKFMSGRTLDTVPLDDLPPDVRAKVTQALAEKQAPPESDTRNKID